jgi:hypothetical protein
MDVLAPRHLNAYGKSRLVIKRLVIKRLIALLRAIERDGKHCADEAILAGLFVGAGSVYIAEKLQQSNAFGLLLLVNASLNLAGPIACALLITVRLSPYWVRYYRLGMGVAWLRVVVPAAITGAILNFYFLLASVVAGILISSRQDVIGEFQLVFAAIRPADLALSSLEASIYVMIASTWTLVESKSSIGKGKPIALVISSVTIHVFATVMATKIAWIFVRQIIF